MWSTHSSRRDPSSGWGRTRTQGSGCKNLDSIRTRGGQIGESAVTSVSLSGGHGVRSTAVESQTGGPGLERGRVCCSGNRVRGHGSPVLVGPLGSGLLRRPYPKPSPDTWRQSLGGGCSGALTGVTDPLEIGLISGGHRHRSFPADAKPSTLPRPGPWQDRAVGRESIQVQINTPRQCPPRPRPAANSHRLRGDDWYWRPISPSSFRRSFAIFSDRGGRSGIFLFGGRSVSSRCGSHATIRGTSCQTRNSRVRSVVLFPNAGSSIWCDAEPAGGSPLDAPIHCGSVWVLNLWRWRAGSPPGACPARSCRRRQ